MTANLRFALRFPLRFPKLRYRVEKEGRSQSDTCTRFLSPTEIVKGALLYALCGKNSTNLRNDDLVRYPRLALPHQKCEVLNKN